MTNISGDETLGAASYFSCVGHNMKNSFKQENRKIEQAKRYLLKYLKELQLHFNLSEDEIKQIMLDIYYSKTHLYHIIRKAKKFLRKSYEN